MVIEMEKFEGFVLINVNSKEGRVGILIICFMKFSFNWTPIFQHIYIECKIYVVFLQLLCKCHIFQY